MSRLADLRRRLVGLPTVVDAALALVLLVATLRMSDAAQPGMPVWGTALFVAVLVQRRWPLLAVALATFGAVHLVGGAARLVPLDLALPITLFTLASRTARRRVGLLVLGFLFVAVYAGSVANAAWYQPPPSEMAVPGVPEFVCEPGEEAKIRCMRAALEADVPPRKRIPVEFSPKDLPPPPPQGAAAVRGVLLHAVGEALLPMLVLGLALAFGDSVRSRRAHLHTLEQRAADLEREQRQREALAAAAERARITRELHDVVAHGVSVMVVQAQGGAAALDRHPDRTATALQNVITTGRASLAEMRRLLGAVNRDAAGGPQLLPQPGVGALPDLVDQVRAAGTPVRLAVDGPPAALPASVDLSAYRIVQEALTNTIKHAGPGAGAVVRLAFEPAWLEIDVSDDGRGAPLATPVGVTPAGGGNGLRGIAQRVDILGGQLATGPAPGGGFRVWALLPLQPVQR